MSDDSGCALLLTVLALCVVLGLGTCNAGLREGRIEGACRVRVEQTRTGADTLAILRQYPECAKYLTASQAAP